MNNTKQQTCRACGSSTFTKGIVKDTHAKIMPIHKFFSTGSPLIYTFCKDCGEVSSIKVEVPGKF